MSEEVSDIVRCDAKVIEIVSEWGRIRSPVYLQRFEPELVEDVFDKLGRSYQHTKILYHGDGHSGFYDENGQRRGSI